MQDGFDIPGACPSCGRPLTKGTVWTEPPPRTARLSFHLTVLASVQLTVWALSILAYVASPPDALNAIIFIYAMLLAVPTFAYALCLILIRVTTRSKARLDAGWQKVIPIGTSIIVGLHALAVLWALLSWLVA